MLRLNIWSWNRTLPLLKLQPTPHSIHQRTSSVGMPRHALRRRMPNTFNPTPAVLGAGVFLHNGGSCAVGEGPWRAPGISDFLTFTYPSKTLGSRKLAVRFGWNLAHVPPSARWRWFPTDVFPAKHFLLTKITVFGVKFSTFFKFHLISRHGYTLALPNLADESLQTVSGMLCEIFSSIGLKLEAI